MENGLRAALPSRTWGCWLTAEHELTMFTCSPEGQPYHGLHQKKCVQQVEGGDSAPLLCSSETPPGVLHPALELSVQERHGAVGAGPEQGHKNDRRDGTPLAWGKAERVGAVQPGEEQAVGRSYCGLPAHEVAYKKAGEGLLTSAFTDRTNSNGFKLKEGRFRLDIKKKFFAGGWWGTCSGKLWMSTTWKCSIWGWMGLWATWSSGRCPCLWQGGWN